MAAGVRGRNPWHGILYNLYVKRDHQPADEFNYFTYREVLKRVLLSDNSNYLSVFGTVQWILRDNECPAGHAGTHSPCSTNRLRQSLRLHQRREGHPARFLDEPVSQVDETDALYMLGSCAAFVSYLINKARQAGLL